MTSLETVIAVLVSLLVRGEYESIERVTNGRRLSAPRLKEAVLGYGRTLVEPPAGWTESIDIVPVDEGERPRFHAAVPLWTREEGRSDLTLELQLAVNDSGTYDAEVLDVHVL